ATESSRLPKVVARPEPRATMPSITSVRAARLRPAASQLVSRNAARVQRTGSAASRRVVMRLGREDQGSFTRFLRPRLPPGDLLDRDPEHDGPERHRVVLGEGLRNQGPEQLHAFLPL